MRNTVMFLLLFGAMITFSSSRPVERPLTPSSGSVYKEPLVLYGNISQTWYNIEGCNITISMTIAFIFDSETFILQGIAVSPYYNVEINCGSGGVMFARPASDVEFKVLEGKLQDVEFQTTNDSKLDKLYLDKTFKMEFLELVKKSQPKP
jgi:hypothetical protein